MTGGAGFIGSHVVDELLDGGHDVTVLDTLLPSAHSAVPNYIDPRASYAWADLTDAGAVAEAVDGIDAVSHQGAMVGLGVDFNDVVDYEMHNCLGTAMLLRALHAARFEGRFVLASSMVVYGEGAYRCPAHGLVRPSARGAARFAGDAWDPVCECGQQLVAEAVTEDKATDPRNVYAATKLHQEHLCNAFADAHPNVGMTILRYHNVYGPRMPRDTPYAGVASIFRSALERGDPPQVYEDGGQMRDFVHVRDVAHANVLAFDAASRPGVICNVASGVPHSVLEMANALADAAGPHAPRPVVVGGGRLGDVRHVFASPARAREFLGFRAQVDFIDGMREFAHVALR